MERISKYLEKKILPRSCRDSNPSIVFRLSLLHKAHGLRKSGRQPPPPPPPPPPPIPNPVLARGERERERERERSQTATKKNNNKPQKKKKNEIMYQMTIKAEINRHKGIKPRKGINANGFFSTRPKILRCRRIMSYVMRSKYTILQNIRDFVPRL